MAGYRSRMKASGEDVMARWAAVTMGVLAALTVAASALGATYAPPVPGDEPVVVTQHKITTPRGVLTYEARAGRIPIRNAESLLYTSDLVFRDPIETGFSRPEKPEFDKESYRHWATSRRPPSSSAPGA
jgi:hypothetical protein